MDRDIGTMLRQVAAATLRMDDRFADASWPGEKNALQATPSTRSTGPNLRAIRATGVRRH